MGRTATGVRGVRLQGPDDQVVGMVVARDPNASLLVVTEKGYGKRSLLEDYRITRRGGGGVLTLRTSARNGTVMAIKAVTDQDELMIMSSGGVIIRLKIEQVSQMGRATQGVKLIQMEAEDHVMDIAHLVAEDEAVAAAGLGAPGNGTGGVGAGSAGADGAEAEDAGTEDIDPAGGDSEDSGSEGTGSAGRGPVGRGSGGGGAEGAGPDNIGTYGIETEGGEGDTEA